MTHETMPLKGKRVRLTDEQRRRLAAKAKLLARRVLSQMATIVTPDTIIVYHIKSHSARAEKAEGGVAEISSITVPVGIQMIETVKNEKGKRSIASVKLLGRTEVQSS